MTAAPPSSANSYSSHPFKTQTVAFLSAEFPPNLLPSAIVGKQQRVALLSQMPMQTYGTLLHYFCGNVSPTGLLIHEEHTSLEAVFFFISRKIEMVELSTICQPSTTPTFSLATFLSGALHVEQDAHFKSKFGNLHATTEGLLNQTSFSNSNEGRKRKRGEAANPANTLDGLVARRADDTHEPFQKRYLTEQEAIEGPDDEVEAKKMERDPDVSTRTCSTCGYVGKWISEMIRHKRVHTNERPFKCRYCSRTSKWKADLIRHVAKTHGIRVVSKYSRSKAFDQSVTKLTNRDDDDKPRVYACEPDKEPERQKQSTIYEENIEVARPEPLLIGVAPLSYRCSHCYFEQVSWGPSSCSFLRRQKNRVLGAT
ncbi:hypothetical protein Y032_0004g1812 [Ancylostoma ceylanicum]|uniref:C2H2-type domain-containing protein n=1 Tax=Ancylostoma ceylanicum TaxID=53326 RepID=A0A016VVR6_9BILA|nr:hypothetical protein Y032_0004g1812 [Ancylostoma ceylanicum]